MRKAMEPTLCCEDIHLVIHFPIQSFNLTVNLRVSLRYCRQLPLQTCSRFSATPTRGQLDFVTSCGVVEALVLES